MMVAPQKVTPSPSGPSVPLEPVRPTRGPAPKAAEARHRPSNTETSTPLAEKSFRATCMRHVREPQVQYKFAPGIRRRAKRPLIIPPPTKNPLGSITSTVFMCETLPCEAPCDIPHTRPHATCTCCATYPGRLMLKDLQSAAPRSSPGNRPGCRRGSYFNTARLPCPPCCSSLAPNLTILSAQAQQGCLQSCTTSRHATPGLREQSQPSHAAIGLPPFPHLRPIKQPKKRDAVRNYQETCPSSTTAHILPRPEHASLDMAARAGPLNKPCIRPTLPNTPASAAHIHQHPCFVQLFNRTTMRW